MFATALLMGLAGGLHCAGMCGPLVLAVTAQRPLALSKVIYSAGRVLTYGLLGVLAGTMGSFIELTSYQNVLAFALGAVLLLTGFGAISGLQVPLLSKALNRFTRWLKGAFSEFLNRKGNGALFILGTLNGLLPCGLTYLAMTYCLTLTTAWDGFLFMLIFGLATIPVMSGAMWLLGLVVNRVKFDFKRISMVVWIVLGSLVIARAVFSHAHNPDDQLHGQTVFEEVLCR